MYAWIYEHFPNLRPAHNTTFNDDQPRALRWIPRRESAVSLLPYREMLDDLKIN